MDTDCSLTKKSDDLGQRACSLEAMKSLVEAVNKTLSEANKVGKIGKILKDGPQSKKAYSTHSDPMNRINFDNAVQKLERDTRTKQVVGDLKGKFTNQLSGIANNLVISEIKALTSDRLTETKKKFQNLTRTYHEISKQGIAVPVHSGFTGSDYWQGHYNMRVAEAMERTVQHNTQRVEKELQVVELLIAATRRNIQIAEELISELPQTSRTFADAALDLSPLSSIRGIGSDTVTLIAECAIGMMSIASELTVMRREAINALKTLEFQAQTYKFSINATRSGHDAKLKESAEYVRSNPDDVPKNTNTLKWFLDNLHKGELKFKAIPVK